MRIDVKKYLFYGSHLVLKEFFQKAQEVGLIHFIESAPDPKEIPLEIQEGLQAIKILRGLPVLPQEELDNVHEAHRIIQQILSIKGRIEKNSEELRVTDLEIERIKPFGHFSLEEIKEIEKAGHRHIQFFFSKKGLVENLPEGLIFVTSDNGLDYFMSIQKETVHPEGLIEMRFDRSLHELQKKKRELIKEIDKDEEALKKLQKYNTFLHIALTENWNVFALDIAQKKAKHLMEGKLFAVPGWVPENKVDELKKVLQTTDVQMEEISIEPDDQIPTCLQNEGLGKIGQDVIKIYDIPSFQDKDPSLWVLLSFALFFAMIIGDGGYGLIFLIVSLIARYKMPSPTPVAKRMLTLFTLLCVFCIGWGFLANSFFGIDFGQNSIFRKVSLVQYLAESKAAYHVANQDAVYNYWLEKYPNLAGAKDYKTFIEGAVKPDGGLEILSTFTSNVMMELALLLGSIHIILSLLRYGFRNYAQFGWILFIIGAYLYLPHYLKSTSLINIFTGISPERFAGDGKTLMIVGLVFALVASVVQNKWKGLLEIMNVIQIFSDILSYLRIYALGLAGAIISVIVNEAAGKMPFYFLSALVLIVGHGFNMVLAVIGGVIHGLRLNFIEWYHYSFEGGGKLFSPLEKKSFRRTT